MFAYADSALQAQGNCSDFVLMPEYIAEDRDLCGVAGMSTTPLNSSVMSGGIFFMGLVVAGMLATTATPNEPRPTSQTENASQPLGL